tara:strand:+ start:1259 stop:3763 length:2505 start_codon:yes stop_codon:yes gene_type:complete
MMPQGEGDGGGGGDTGRPRTPTGRETTSTVTEAEDNLRLAEDIVTAKIMTNEQLLRQKQIMEEINMQMGDAFEAQKARMSQQQIFISNLSSDIQKLIGEEGISADFSKLDEKYKDFIGSNKALYEEITKIALDAKGDSDKVANSIEALKGELDTAKGAAEEFDGGLRKITKSFGFASSASNTLVGSISENILKFGKLESAAAKQEFIQGIGKSISQSISPMNIMGSMFDKMISSALEFDTALKKLQASLGVTQDLLLANSGGIARMGLTASDQATIIKTLTTEFKGFGREVGANTTELKTNVAALQALGVEASDNATILTTMQIGLGKSTKEIMNLTTSLAANSKAFGMTKNQIISDFASMSSNLVSYGDEMGEVFIKLAEQAKRTGIAIKSLNTLAEGFDSFKDAATRAAQTNALFNTNISAMGMVSMDAGERLEELKRQFQGIDPSSLGRFQKLALKDALGFSSVAEAVQFLGGRLSKAEEEQIKNINLQKDMSKTMQDLAIATLPFVKQLENMFSNLTSNEEIMKSLLGGIKFLADSLIFLTSNIEATIVTLVGLKMIGLVLPPILAAVTGGATSMGAAFMISLGPVGAVAAALLVLFGILHLTKSPPFYLLFGVVATGIFAMGMAAQTTQAGLYALAAAALAIGVAISAVFYTLSMAIDSFTGLFTVLSEGAENFPKAAAGLHLMAGGMMSLGTASVFASTGLSAALAALSALTAIFNLGGSDIEDLVKAGDSITKMGDSVGKFGSGLEKIKAVAVELKNSLGDSVIAAAMEGSKMSVIVGKEAGVATLFKNNTLNIKVDMPQINIPTPEFVIQIDGKFIDAKVEQRYNK